MERTRAACARTIVQEPLYTDAGWTFDLQSPLSSALCAQRYTLSYLRSTIGSIPNNLNTYPARLYHIMADSVYRVIGELSEDFFRIDIHVMTDDPDNAIDNYGPTLLVTVGVQKSDNTVCFTSYIPIPSILDVSIRTAHDDPEPSYWFGSKSDFEKRLHPFGKHLLEAAKKRAEALSDAKQPYEPGENALEYVRDFYEGPTSLAFSGQGRSLGSMEEPFYSHGDPLRTIEETAVDDRAGGLE